MRSSLVGVTYDLLEFEGTGNFGQFDRCFTKASAYLAIPHDSAERRKMLRNTTFRYLRTTGFLDVQDATKTTWSTVPAHLVQCSDTDFVFIGGSMSMATLREFASTVTLCAIVSESADVKSGATPLYPNLVRVSGPLSEIAVLSQRSQIPLSLFYQRRLFQHMPSLKFVLANAVEEEVHGAMFEPNSTTKLDFSSSNWEPYAETRAFEPGLYRRSFEHGPPAYQIAASSKDDQIVVFRVKQREWVLVAALALLGLSLPLQYTRDSRRLSVFRGYDRVLRLPTLIERCFRSGTFMNPSSNRDWINYEGIDSESVQRLTSRLPIFTYEAI